MNSFKRLGVGIGCLLVANAALANDREGRPAFVELGGGVQATASGPRALIAIGFGGVPVRISRDYQPSAYIQRGVRLFWAQARFGIGQGVGPDSFAYADVEVVPVAYEEIWDERGGWRVEILPSQYQRETAIGLQDRATAYLVGFQFHADSSGPGWRPGPGNPQLNSYVDLIVRGAGALYSRFDGLTDGAGISIASGEAAIGGRWEGDDTTYSGWLVRFEARGRVAADLVLTTSGAWQVVAPWEAMARIAIGYRFGYGRNHAETSNSPYAGPEVEFFVRGGARGMIGNPALYGGVDGSRASEVTPVVEAGIGGRF